MCSVYLELLMWLKWIEIILFLLSIKEKILNGIGKLACLKGQR